MGIPIIAYPIKAALESNLFEEVMVSTDDLEIAELATTYGAIVPFLRSKKTADDYATTVDVLVEVLNAYSNNDFSFEYGCCLYPTAPFITPELLKLAYTKLHEGAYDSVFPVMPFTFPVQRALTSGDDGKLTMLYPEYLNTRSQDLPVAYHDAGQFYFFKSEILISKKKLYTDNSSGITLSEMSAHDIDNEEDWRIAEFKYALSKNNG